MAHKKIAKTAKRRLTILTPIVILAVGYFAFTLITTGVQLFQLNNEEKQLKEQLKDLKGQSEELKTEITKLQDKDYVARYARENYLYTKDGEYVIKVDTEEEEKEDNKFVLDEGYIIYGAIGLGLFVILYIIFKHRKKKKEKSLKQKKTSRKNR